MNESAKNEFELKGKSARAVGVMTDEGFLVRAGAIARKEIVPSGVDTVTPIRNLLFSEAIRKAPVCVNFVDAGV